MAYTKTTWVNGSVPTTGLETDPSLATGISADNLNKMEQGIEDAGSGVASLGFKTVDPAGGGDYLTIDEAYTDNEFKLFLWEGVHTVSTNLPRIPIGGTLHLKGAGRGLTTVHFTGASYYLGKPAENVDTANKFPTGGTYTLGGSFNNTISLTGLTFSGGDTSITDLWEVGSVLAFSDDINHGCAEITAISGIGSTGSVTFARIPRELLDDSNFGFADWLWSINSINFVAEDFTITSTASANAALKQDSGTLGAWRTIITNVGTTKNISFSGDTNVSWNTYMLNCNLNGYDQPGALGQVDYCSFGSLFGRLGKYNGDVQFSNCWIVSCSASDSPWDNLYCRFNDCNFGFDISAHATFGKSAPTSAKLFNCMDINGPFTQPDGVPDVAFATVGAGGDYATVHGALDAGERNVKVLAGRHVWYNPAPVLYDPTVDGSPVTIIGEGEGITFLETDWANSGTDGMLVMDATNQTVGDVANTFVVNNTKNLFRTGGSWIADGFYTGMSISSGVQSQNPMYVAELTATDLYLDSIPQSSAILSGGTCDIIKEYMNIELHMGDITVEFGGNWDWITHYNSPEPWSAGFNHIFTNMTLYATTSGTKHAWDDGYGFPKHFRNVKTLGYQSGSSSFNIYPSPGTIFEGCNLHTGVWSSEFGQITFTGCRFPEASGNLQDNNTIFIGCHFEFDVKASFLWGDTGNADTPTFIGCTDGVVGDVTQRGNRFWVQSSQTNYTFPQIDGADGILKCYSGVATVDLTDHTQFANGQTITFHLTGASVAISLGSFDAFDSNTGKTVVTVTRGTANFAYLQVMYSKDDGQFLVVDYNVAGDGSVVYSNP